MKLTLNLEKIMFPFSRTKPTTEYTLRMEKKIRARIATLEDQERQLTAAVNEKTDLQTEVDALTEQRRALVDDISHLTASRDSLVIAIQRAKGILAAA